MIHLALTKFAAAASTAVPECKNYKNFDFFGFPHWYKYLDGIKDQQGHCVPSIGALSDIWRIVAAVIEILLRISTIAAVAVIIYGGVTYITSQGEPDKTAKARTTIVNALVGMALSIMASLIITFVAGSIK